MELFGAGKPVIGMVHLPALPGAPGYGGGMEAVRRRMLEDAEALVAGGVDALMVENFGDAPFFPGRVPRHTVACMAVLARELKQRYPLPLGVNVLRNDGESALSVAAAAGADFIRVNVYVGARVTDQGVIEGCAHRVQRLKRTLGAGVAVFADVDVKHSAPLAARPLEEEVEEAVLRGGADAIIVTGRGSGYETALEDVRAAKSATAAPVFCGSGATAENAARVLSCADGIIAGTALKRGGVTANAVDPQAVRAFMDAVRRFRGR
jgi:membrane complex biogenesis BtpA family protein